MITSPRRRQRALGAVLGLCALSAACASTPSSAKATTSTSSGSFPVTVIAANGPVRITARPRAIVSLSPTATEMLYAIGAGGQVKAVDKDSDYPRRAPRTKLDPLQPNVEAIVAYRPDLVIEAGDSANLTGRLAAFHIPVLSEPAVGTLQGAYNQIEQLGAATGHVQQAAREVSSMESEIAAVVRSVPPSHTVHTYYYELDPTYYSATSTTFIGRALSLLGLTNIADAASGATASGGYPQLSSEYIVAADPDYIFLADTLCCGQDAATVAARPGWSTITAVLRHHVVGLNDDIASRWGPRIVDLLRTVARALTASGSG